MSEVFSPKPRLGVMMARSPERNTQYAYIETSRQPGHGCLCRLDRFVQNRDYVSNMETSPAENIGHRTHSPGTVLHSDVPRRCMCRGVLVFFASFNK